MHSEQKELYYFVLRCATLGVPPYIQLLAPCLVTNEPLLLLALLLSSNCAWYAFCSSIQILSLAIRQVTTSKTITVRIAVCDFAEQLKSDTIVGYLQGRSVRMLCKWSVVIERYVVVTSFSYLLLVIDFTTLSGCDLLVALELPPLISNIAAEVFMSLIVWGATPM